MRRAKVQALYCTSCDSVIDATPAFCEVCGRPTPFATYDDKTAYEVAQWRAYSGGRNGDADGVATFRAHAVEGSAGTRSTSAAVIDRLEMHGDDDDLAPWQRRLAMREEARARREAEEVAARDADAQRAAEEVAARDAEAHRAAAEAAEAQEFALRAAARRHAETVVVHESRTESDAVPEQPLPAIAPETTGITTHDENPEPARGFFSWVRGRSEGTYRRCLECGGSDWVLRAGGNDDETYRYWCVRCGRSFFTDLRMRHAVKPWLVSAAVIAALAVGVVRFA